MSFLSQSIIYRLKVALLHHVEGLQSQEHASNLYKHIDAKYKIIKKKRFEKKKKKNLQELLHHALHNISDKHIHCFFFKLHSMQIWKYADKICFLTNFLRYHDIWNPW